MSRARGLLLAALGLVALAAVWIAMGPAAERPGVGSHLPAESSDMPSPGRASGMPSGPAMPPAVSSGMPSEPSGEVPSPGDEADAPGVRQLGPVEAYLRYAVYPPDSRPLDARQSDLIDWNRRHESARPDPSDPELTVLFTADRFHLVGQQTLSPVLDVRRAGQPAAAGITDSLVILPDGRRVPFTLARTGEVYAGAVRPADLALSAPTRLELWVAFDAGAGHREARFFAHYTPDDAIPARFGAALGDRLVDGSLEVSVEIDVQVEGLYLIDANLFAAAGPVAWTRVKQRFAPGTHPVALRFFGKAIVDAGSDGPFTVEQLRGALAAPGSTPPTVQMPPFEGSIATGAYGVGDFSAAEWDGPQKRDRLARLRRLEAMGGPRVTTPVRVGDPGAP